MRKSDPNFIDVEELMRIAIDFEEDSIQFYRRMRGKTDDAQVTDVLTMLEKQEVSHKEILQDYELGPGPYAVLQYGPSFSLSMPMVSEEEDLSLASLLDIAVGRETRSAQIYQRSSELVKGKLSELLMQLAGFEREHEEKLISLTTYVKSEDWL
jgi:rubrerythrin